MHSLPRLTSLLSAACMMLTLSAGAQNFDKIDIKTEKLSPNVYVLYGAGGNLGVSIGEDAVFVIDDQYAPMTARITAAIKALTDKPVQFVLNTHWHGDHTGGNENLARAGVLIVAQENVRKRLSSEQFIELMKSKVPASPKAALPVVTFSSDITFHLNGDEIFVFHVPHAHTDGDAIVHFRKSNIIHLGDTFFNGLYPFIDTSTGGSPDGVIAAVDRVLAMADDATRLIPGHGPLGGKADLKAYRDMLATVSGRIKALAREGRKLDDVIAARPSAEFDERWGKGFMPPARFIEMIYAAYAPKATQ